ncbi:MAG: carboxylating nicotinate-nucleotide diphosphorylase [Candidatus Omnitrophica bacterium]|nr:carboxylating nicotinate-nucleotide diphosphorylase [Candidatus Omnitrophota bacterium]
MELNSLISAAFKEDIGRGDITSSLVIPHDIKARAVIIAKQEGVLCGMEVAKKVFNAVDKRIQFVVRAKDGKPLKKGMIAAEIRGPARGILTAERTALNFLSHLSGISTLTAEFVRKVKPYKVKILDTRKTTPGLRTLEKYAVKTGGGHNHRAGLFDMVLIKDNHIKACGKDNVRTIPEMIRIARKTAPRGIKIEVEVESKEEFRSAIAENPDIIMLDNMSIKDIKEAVRLRNRLNRRVLLEVSGGVTSENVREFARTGVDMISIGALTHSAPALDFSLDIR